MRIETEDAYRAAVDEVQDLTGAIEDSAEEARLIEITDAIEEWERRHNL
jgi:hypothetical protein